MYLRYHLLSARFWARGISSREILGETMNLRRCPAYFCSAVCLAGSLSTGGLLILIFLNKVVALYYYTDTPMMS